MELNTIHGWRFLENSLSLSLPGRSLSCCLSFPSSFIPRTQSFGQELASSSRQIFPGFPKAILPRFPLDLYPLPMFQIIYRRIYLLYVVMRIPLATLKSPLFIHWLYLLYLVYFCLSQPLHTGLSIRGLQRWWRLMAPLQKKTSMMQLCCHLRVTNTQWQTIRKGEEKAVWCHWQIAMTFESLWPPECIAHAVFTSGQ